MAAWGGVTPLRLTGGAADTEVAACGLSPPSASSTEFDLRTGTTSYALNGATGLQRPRCVGVCVAGAGLPLRDVSLGSWNGCLDVNNPYKNQ